MCDTAFPSILIAFFSVCVAFLGVIIVLALWIIDYKREKRIEKKLKKLLIQELKTNKEIIDNNLDLIKGGAGADIAFEFNTEIFDSIVNSTKIVILDEEYIELLFIFYNTIYSVRQIMFSPFKGLVSSKLDEAEKSLGKIFTYLKEHKNGEYLG